MKKLALAFVTNLTFIMPTVHAFAQETDINVDEQSVIEAALIAEAIKIMKRNVEASKRESGEIDKLVRAMSGISVKDIEKYGLCGGPNSEVRKLFGSLCNDI